MQIVTKSHVQVSGDLDFKLDFEMIKSTYSKTLNLKVTSKFYQPGGPLRLKICPLGFLIFLCTTVKLGYIRLRGKNGKSACTENRCAFNHKELRNAASTAFTSF